MYLVRSVLFALSIHLITAEVIWANPMSSTSSSWSGTVSYTAVSNSACPGGKSYCYHLTDVGYVQYTAPTNNPPFQNIQLSYSLGAAGMAANRKDQCAILYSVDNGVWTTITQTAVDTDISNTYTFTTPSADNVASLRIRLQHGGATTHECYYNSFILTGDRITTKNPTPAPSAPTALPTKTQSPTNNPSSTPTTALPTKSPTDNPTKVPTIPPSKFPTKSPNTLPTKRPTTQPPTFQPSVVTSSPSDVPTNSPTLWTIPFNADFSSNGYDAMVTKLTMSAGGVTTTLTTGDQVVFVSPPAGTSTTITMYYSATKPSGIYCSGCIRQMLFRADDVTRSCRSLSSGSYTLSFTYTSDGGYKALYTGTDMQYGCSTSTRLAPWYIGYIASRTEAPTSDPTVSPTSNPTLPTVIPTTGAPSVHTTAPTDAPSQSTSDPSATPTGSPSTNPTVSPSAAPTSSTGSPTPAPTRSTANPTAPTVSPYPTACPGCLETSCSRSGYCGSSRCNMCDEPKYYPVGCGSGGSGCRLATTVIPTHSPSDAPTVSSTEPSPSPTKSPVPTQFPTSPSLTPTNAPIHPTVAPVNPLHFVLRYNDKSWESWYSYKLYRTSDYTDIIQDGLDAAFEVTYGHPIMYSQLESDSWEDKAWKRAGMINVDFCRFSDVILSDDCPSYETHGIDGKEYVAVAVFGVVADQEVVEYAKYLREAVQKKAFEDAFGTEMNALLDAKRRRNLLANNFELVSIQIIDPGNALQSKSGSDGFEAMLYVIIGGSTLLCVLSIVCCCWRCKRANKKGTPVFADDVELAGSPSDHDYVQKNTQVMSEDSD
eukprot:93963_1